MSPSEIEAGFRERIRYPHSDSGDRHVPLSRKFTKNGYINRGPTSIQATDRFAAYRIPKGFCVARNKRSPPVPTAAEIITGNSFLSSSKTSRIGDERRLALRESKMFPQAASQLNQR